MRVTAPRPARTIPMTVRAPAQAWRWRYSHGAMMRCMPDRGGVPQRHQVVVELEAVLSFCAFIGILPVSCGVGYPTTYQNDITLIDLVKGDSRMGPARRGRADSTQGPARLQINEGGNVLVLASGGQGPAAVAGAQMLLPSSRRCRQPGWFWPGGGGLVPGRLAAGGRPRGRIGRARPGSRPASASARRSRNSIWALVLRSSSPAHRARASWTAGSSRSSTLLRSVTAVP
jgi:hypothetical protein